MRIPGRKLKTRTHAADHTHMGPEGRLLRRLPSSLLICLVALGLSPTASAAERRVDLTAGEHGSGMPAPVTRAVLQASSGPAIRWTDIEPPYGWVRPAADWVGEEHDWMRDYRANADGEYPFRPGKLEPRRLFARALVRAFAPDDEPDPDVTFTDLDPDSRFYAAANVAVKRGWLGRNRRGAFRPDKPVTMTAVHRALVRAVGLRSTAAAIDAMRTREGYRFDTPRNLGVRLLGMRLYLRYNNADETQDVTPTSKMNRAQVAWSLYKATTLPSWLVPRLQEQYDDIELPGMNAKKRAVVDWALGYVGYPYIWGGEWGLESPEPLALGGQPGPGFDCSGITWWVTRKDDGAWQVAPPRPYRGWRLPQRTSRDMATMTPERLDYEDLRPGDLMFYDGDDADSTVDHVNVYAGNGYAIDSSSSIAGVTIMWVGEDSWYLDHYKWGRRIIGS